MKKNQIIILALAVLILAGIVTWVFLQKQDQGIVPSEETIPAGAEENFYLYLELPSRSGKFLKFDEAKSEIHILYFDTEAMKIAAKAFRVDGQTIFSKATFEPYQPDLFPQKDLEKVRQETQTTVFYLSAENENENPLARLIQVRASF